MLSLEKFDKWCNNQKSHCLIKHEGSFFSTETVATVEMFLRSTSKRSLRYTINVGAGDSPGFANVREECFNKFGASYTVEKEECLGHE